MFITTLEQLYSSVTAETHIKRRGIRFFISYHTHTYAFTVQRLFVGNRSQSVAQSIATMQDYFYFKTSIH